MKLRVYHIPQLPMKPFYVEVDSVREGVKVMSILGDYDDFQLKNNVKGDYCNTNGLQMYDESLTDRDLKDMFLEDRWVDWYIEDVGPEEEFFDDPEEYLDYISNH